MKTIHINCDLGEGGENDAQLMPLISACNIACGGHAGTIETMKKTVDLAMEHEVEIGAHPSYPDKENFGRRNLKIESSELKRSLKGQILSLKQITEAEGAILTHIKPHGALYNDAAKDPILANIIIETVLEIDEYLQLFVPPFSVISEEAEGKLKVVFEAFADRNYNPDHSLVSRENPAGLITEKEQVFEHLFRMISKGEIRCLNGEIIPSKAITFCLHSDTPNSEEILLFLKEKLEAKNFVISNSYR